MASEDVTADNMRSAIDTQQEELQQRLDEVRQTMDNYLSKEKERLLLQYQKTQHTRRDQAERIQSLQNAISSFTHLVEAQQQALQAAKTAHAEASSSLKSLQDRHDEIQPKYQQCKQEQDALDATLRNKRKDAHERQQVVSVQEQLNHPELLSYVEYTGLTMSSQGEDRIKFDFVCVNERDWDRHCSFILDLANNNYTVSHIEPPLERMSLLVEDLKQDRNLYRFIKRARQAFCDLP